MNKIEFKNLDQMIKKIITHNQNNSEKTKISTTEQEGCSGNVMILKTTLARYNNVPDRF